MGIPKPTDVAAQLRHHAQRIADGDHPRPARALVIEFDARGVRNLESFGIPCDSHREAIADLLDACSFLNAEAAN